MLWILFELLKLSQESVDELVITESWFGPNAPDCTSSTNGYEYYCFQNLV